MTMEQMENGKRWVEETITKLATEYNVPVADLLWGEGGKDFDSNMLSLVFFLGNKRYVEKFSRNSLEDCPGSENVRVQLENRLRRLIRSTTSQSTKGRKGV